MASGEYVSVSSQRDSERAMLALERRELAESPQAEVAELARIYEAKGLQPGLARHVAERLTARDALAAHAQAELGIDPERRGRSGPCRRGEPGVVHGRGGAATAGHHAGAGAGADRGHDHCRLAALVATGAANAALGRAPRRPAVVRNVIGGAKYCQWSSS